MVNLHQPIINEINKLKQQPLFYLFLSSRELFHSNFWYWLYTINPLAAYQLFAQTGTITPVGPIAAEREKNKKDVDTARIDLMFSENNIPLLVIENKVKDIATHEQLLRIQRAFPLAQHGHITFVLTTLFSSPVPKGWHQLLYKDLNTRLNNFPAVHHFHMDLIKEYQLLLTSLVDFSKLLPATNNYDFALDENGPLYDILNEVKLWELYQRKSASHFGQKIHSALVNKFGPDVKTHVSINHQKATLDFYIELSSQLNVGVQLENNQYRKYISRHKKGKKNIDHVIQTAMTQNLFFNPSYHPPKSKKRHYLNYDSTFRYQYDAIPKGSRTFNAIYKQIEADISFIIKHKVAFQKL